MNERNAVKCEPSRDFGHQFASMTRSAQRSNGVHRSVEPTIRPRIGSEVASVSS